MPPEDSSTRKRVAIVDDEHDILELVSLHMKRSGFDTAIFDNATEFLKDVDQGTPDLVILDLMLPDTNGVEVCRKLRMDSRTSAIPVIMLTALGEETDRIVGLEMGADDYVTKPFSPRELVARVKAVLRRCATGAESDSGTIRFGDLLVIDTHRFTATSMGRDTELTSTEFRILAVLAGQPGRVFTRDQILEKLWGNEKAVLDRTVDVHIRHIREKLGDAAGMIRSVRGIGYKLEP
jgi:DNA-binding response OmpR family regulator